MSQRVLTRAGSDSVIKTTSVVRTTQRQISSAGVSRRLHGNDPPTPVIRDPTSGGVVNGSHSAVNGGGGGGGRDSVKKLPLLPPSSARQRERESDSSESSFSSEQSGQKTSGSSEVKRPLMPPAMRPAPPTMTSSPDNETTCNGRLYKPLPPTPPRNSLSPSNQSPSNQSPRNRSRDSIGDQDTLCATREEEAVEENGANSGHPIARQDRGKRDVVELESENESLKRRIMELEQKERSLAEENHTLRQVRDMPTFPVSSSGSATPTYHHGDENLGNRSQTSSEASQNPSPFPVSDSPTTNEQGFTPMDPKVAAARIQLSRVINRARTSSPDITKLSQTTQKPPPPSETAESPHPSLSSPLSPLSPATPSPTSLATFGLASQAKRRAIKRPSPRNEMKREAAVTERESAISDNNPSHDENSDQQQQQQQQQQEDKQQESKQQQQEEQEALKPGQFAGKQNKSIVSMTARLFQTIDEPDAVANGDDSSHTHPAMPPGDSERGKESISSESDEVFIRRPSEPTVATTTPTQGLLRSEPHSSEMEMEGEGGKESHSSERDVERERVRLGVISKRTPLKSDVSWIKEGGGGGGSQRSDSPSQGLQRPYRSHNVTRSHPHAVTKHPLPTHTSPKKPPHHRSQGLITMEITGAAGDEKRGRLTSVSGKEGSKWNKRRGRKEDEGRMSRSMSDESLHGTIQRGTEVYSSHRPEAKKAPVGRPKQPLLRHISSDNNRPTSVLVEQSKPPRDWGREDDFTVSCTVPSGSIAMEKSQKRAFKKSHDQNPLTKKGSLFGRFRVKPREKQQLPTISSGTVLEEEEEGESDSSSSEDEKGATIKFKPKLRPVSVRRPSQVEDDFDLSYPQLFERVFVVGLKTDPATNKLVTEVTYTFPPRPPSETCRDETLEAIPQFCFPDIDRLKPTTKFKSETFSFVLTNIEGNRRFGYCRRLLPAGKGARLPEVTCLVSPLGCFSLYEKILDHIEERRQVSTTAVFTFLKAIVSNPFPKPGRSVEVRAFSARGGGLETVTFTRPLDSRLEHVDFSLLFLSLPPRKIIQVFSSMLMERRIILCSSNLSLLTGCAHALLALLYPFEWQHVFIPVLPGALIDFCCSPLPYLMGMSPTLIPALDEMDTMEEALVVDLDKKKFMKKIGDEASILPSKLFQYLEHTLSANAITAEYQRPTSRRRNPCRADEIITNTFMIFFVYLYGDYRQYMERRPDGSRLFKKKDYEKKFSSKSIRRFLEAFHMTQMFDSFAEQRENPLKFETTAQSTFERSTISEMKGKCEQIEIFSSKPKFSRWGLRKRI